jgi:hypothetical protein
VPTLGAEERFRAWFAAAAPDYFIVEDLRELDQQPDLKRFLGKFPTVSATDHYLVVRLPAR